MNVDLNAKKTLMLLVISVSSGQKGESQFSIFHLNAKESSWIYKPIKEEDTNKHLVHFLAGIDLTNITLDK